MASALLFRGTMCDRLLIVFRLSVLFFTFRVSRFAYILLMFFKVRVITKG